jgi:site-specific recombinase XerD
MLSGKVRQEHTRRTRLGAGVVNAQGKAKYGVHKMRHFFASWAIEQQFEAKRLQEILGHSWITMPYDRYGH